MQNLKSQVLDRGAAFLQLPQIKARLDKQTLTDIASQKKEFFMADFYIRKKLHSVSGIVDIIKETDSLQAGVTNIDKSKLYPGVYLALTSVGISYGFDASEQNADAITYSSAIKSTPATPVKFVNSEFTLKAGGNVLLKCRTKRFLSLTSTEYAIEANDENNLLLPVPKLIAGEKKIEALLEFADNGAAMPEGNHFIEIRLQGVYIGDR